MSTEITEHKNITSMILDSSTIESYKEMAKLMAQSQVSIPDHFKGKPADCLAIVFKSAQWKMDPFTVSQKTHIINGVLGYEAQLVNSVISSSNAIKGRFHYQYAGEREDWKPRMVKTNKNGRDNWRPEFSAKACVRVGAIIRGEDSITWGEWTYPCDQSIFNSPLWKTNPKQQAGYLALKFWARFYTPDVLMGVYTVDEVEEKKQVKDINPEPEFASDNNKPESAISKLQKASKKPVKAEKPIEQYDNVDSSETIQPDTTEAAELDISPVIYGEYLYSISDCKKPDDLNALATSFGTDERLDEKQKADLWIKTKEAKLKLSEV